MTGFIIGLLIGYFVVPKIVPILATLIDEIIR